MVRVIFIGAKVLVGGFFQIVQAFMTKQWSGFLLNLLVGILYVIGGFLIMQEPVHGSFIITLLLLSAILVGGMTRIMIALRHRELSGWWLMLLGGIISVILAIMLYASLPWSGLWVLGTLIAIELLIHGCTWLQALACHCAIWRTLPIDDHSREEERNAGWAGSENRGCGKGHREGGKKDRLRELRILVHQHIAQRADGVDITVNTGWVGLEGKFSSAGIGRRIGLFSGE